MKNTKLPSLISILVLTLITAVMWVSLSVYSALTKKPTPVVPQDVSSVLTPTLDANVIKQIETRVFMDDSQISEIKLAGGNATPTVKPIASESATPIP